MYEERYQVDFQNDVYPLNGSYFDEYESLPKTKLLIIVAYWRSGSTFLGDLLQQNDDTFYSFEPLRGYVVSKGNIDAPENVTQSFNIMRQILDCNFEEISKYRDKSVTQYDYRLNNVLKSHCTTFTYCSPKLVENVCRKCELHVIKTVRLTLKQAFQFVRTLNYSENVKIVHLVRDPRAIFNSRRNLWLHWCTGNCANLSMLCERMNDDFKTFMEIKKQFPKNVFRVYYEQLAFDTINYTRELYKVLNLKFSRQVLTFIQIHTSVRAFADFQSPETIRNSRNTISKWYSESSVSEINKIQNVCKRKEDTHILSILQLSNEY
ncbi:secreted protein-like protein [Leptotrombidium deliense]|uniref:Secreted protein-like protein n=1 Tax=Leptotrombidium deliense TaxID=299467 RepID=A0A443S538_9ACAR|nr:secreted protein-like protein [Leptotrombidium deliense]